MLIGRERTQRSQVVKQADVVALQALLPEEFPGEMAEANFRYYERRCAHGSSLSAGLHALVAARLGDFRAGSTPPLQRCDGGSGTGLNSAGGIRIAGLGGVWQAVVLGFAGLDVSDDGIGINPRLPPTWPSISFKVYWRGRAIDARVSIRALRLRFRMVHRSRSG